MNVCLHNFWWNVNTINEIYSIEDDSVAELKVVYGKTSREDFCVKEEKQSYIQMDLLAIMQATGLSKEDIEKIKADMN